MEKKQNLNSIETTLKLNIAEFLAEYFTGSTGAKDQFSYGLFWDTVMDDSLESIKIMVDYMPKDEGDFYYEYGLLKAEEEMEAEQQVTEKLISRIDGRKLYSYNIRYENPGEKPVSFYFYTRTRIMAFIQYENETLEVAWEMQEITKQKPVLCLESHTVLFRGALDCILEAYSKDEYSEEELQREYCPDATEVAVYKMRYKFTGSYNYRTNYCRDGYVYGNNVRRAIEAAWTWFRTGYVNNFISLNPATHRIHLSW